MLKGPSEGQGEEGNGGVDFAGLLGLLGGIGGGEEKPPPPPAPRGDGGGMPFDPAMLSTLSRAMAALREPDRNILLLQALRPFLEPERQKRVDEAVKRPAGVAGTAGPVPRSGPIPRAPAPPGRISHRINQPGQTPRRFSPGGGP